MVQQRVSSVAQLASAWAATAHSTAAERQGKRPGRTRITHLISAPVSGIPKGIDHSAMFPVETPAEKLIQTFCPPNGIVLDPFAGSGSTLAAAKQLGHDYYGIEIMKEFCLTAPQRLAGAEANLPKAGIIARTRAACKSPSLLGRFQFPAFQISRLQHNFWNPIHAPKNQAERPVSRSPVHPQRPSGSRWHCLSCPSVAQIGQARHLRGDPLFRRSAHPYAELQACGQWADAISFCGSSRFGFGGPSPIHSGQNTPRNTSRWPENGWQRRMADKSRPSLPPDTTTAVTVTTRSSGNGRHTPRRAK